MSNPSNRDDSMGAPLLSNADTPGSLNNNPGNEGSSFVPISILSQTAATIDTKSDYALDDDEEFDNSQGMPEFVDADAMMESEWSKRIRYLSYYVPVTVWLPKYNKANLIPDLLAGLSIGAMLIPQSMAYAGILGIPPIYGLITGIFPQIIYFVFGHSPVLTCGGESTTTMLLIESIRGFPHIQEANERGEDLVPLIIQASAAISLLAGLFTLLLGVFRLGFVEGVFSRTILAAFVTAAGFLLLLDQTPKMIGLPSCHHCDNTIDKLKFLWNHTFKHFDVHGTTAAIGLSCVVFMILFKMLKSKYPDSVLLSRIPHIFVMVIFVTCLSYAFDLPNRGVRTLGEASSSFPPPAFPTFSKDTEFSSYLSTAIILSILGFVETNLIHKITDTKGVLISPNRELVALGIMHVVTSLFQGWAPFGSLTRTKVAVQVGARSQITSLVAFVMITAAALVCMPFFGHMPVAVTSGILFVVALSLLEFHVFMFCWKMKEYLECALFVVMVIITFFFGVDIGLFFAFACCVLLVIKNQNKPAVRLLGRMGTGNGAPVDSSTVDFVSTSKSSSNINDKYYEYDNSANLTNQSLEGILIYQIDGPLFFSNSEGLRARTKRIEMQGSVRSHPSEPIRPLDLKSIIFDMTAVTQIDASAANVLIEILQDYQTRNVRVIFVKVRKTLAEQLDNAGISELLGNDNFYSSIDSAVKSVQDTNNTSINI